MFTKTQFYLCSIVNFKFNFMKTKNLSKGLYVGICLIVVSLISHSAYCQKPIINSGIEIIKSVPPEIISNNSISVRKKDNILYSWTGANIKVEGKTNIEKATGYVNSLKEDIGL